MRDRPRLRAIEFLTGQGLARGNPQAALRAWLTARLAALPAPIAAEVRTWAEALQGRGPRAGRPRQASTIQGYLRVLQAPLASWSARYESLCQVTTGDLTAELAPLSGATRLLALTAMRSLFSTFKASRVLFTNPATPLTGPRGTTSSEPAMRRAGPLTVTPAWHASGKQISWLTAAGRVLRLRWWLQRRRANRAKYRVAP